MTENQTFFIQYNQNQPVKIETRYIGEQERRRPLTDVADLVAAYKTAVAPLLDNSSLAQLTLHSVTDGVEATYNTWDSLTALGPNGKTGTSPLIIRSRGMRYIYHRSRSAGKVAKLFQYANF
jgi:hypothetical protein